MTYDGDSESKRYVPFIDVDTIAVPYEGQSIPIGVALQDDTVVGIYYGNSKEEKVNPVGTRTEIPSDKLAEALARCLNNDAFMRRSPRRVDVEDISPDLVTRVKGQIRKVLD